jgi:hypothetical protein
MTEIAAFVLDLHRRIGKLSNNDLFSCGNSLINTYHS